ncbi:MAG: twin-arginine translocation signal domain-containing protein [Zhongshania sp.]|uniref:twin-arginine translocation signal domain-containing protein n=1 Tax=Zhongshania sp. TaxID=1971902 RepID=UPI002616C761|nr:twin-arginine translocation signal domain-containing protein [Zhongshania sp.]MDF1693945.1 twin-arginine translocation signal domain-containing protein [Zhongshania sp.]
MHLGYLNCADELDKLDANNRRSFLKKTGAALLVAGASPAMAFTAPKSAKGNGGGFDSKGRMGMSTGEDWIDTFFNGGAKEIIHYYADDFVFEDITFFQTIETKEELYRAFLPFDNNGPDSPLGVHQFDIIRYDGGPAGDRTALLRQGVPEGYSESEWKMWSAAASTGADHDYDEWAVMNWVWKASHNMDFLGLPAKGKTTHTRGITFHCYKNRKIVREFTYWNFRDVAIQLGAFPEPNKFWLKK